MCSCFYFGEVVGSSFEDPETAPVRCALNNPGIKAPHDS